MDKLKISRDSRHLSVDHVRPVRHSDQCKWLFGYNWREGGVISSDIKIEELNRKVLELKYEAQKLNSILKYPVYKKGYSVQKQAQDFGVINDDSKENRRPRKNNPYQRPLSIEDEHFNIHTESSSSRKSFPEAPKRKSRKKPAPVPPSTSPSISPSQETHQFSTIDIERQRHISPKRHRPSVEYPPTDQMHIQMKALETSCSPSGLVGETIISPPCGFSDNEKTFDEKSHERNEVSPHSKNRRQSLGKKAKAPLPPATVSVDITSDNERVHDVTADRKDSENRTDEIEEKRVPDTEQSALSMDFYEFSEEQDICSDVQDIPVSSNTQEICETVEMEKDNFKGYKTQSSKNLIKSGEVYMNGTIENEILSDYIQSSTQGIENQESFTEKIKDENLQGKEAVLRETENIEMIFDQQSSENVSKSNKYSTVITIGNNLPVKDELKSEVKIEEKTLSVNAIPAEKFPEVSSDKKISQNETPLTTTDTPEPPPRRKSRKSPERPPRQKRPKSLDKSSISNIKVDKETQQDTKPEAELLDLETISKISDGIRETKNITDEDIKETENVTPKKNIVQDDNSKSGGQLDHGTDVSLEDPPVLEITTSISDDLTDRSISESVKSENSLKYKTKALPEEKQLVEHDMAEENQKNISDLELMESELQIDECEYITEKIEVEDLKMEVEPLDLNLDLTELHDQVGVTQTDVKTLKTEDCYKLDSNVEPEDVDEQITVEKSEMQQLPHESQLDQTVISLDSESSKVNKEEIEKDKTVVSDDVSISSCTTTDSDGDLDAPALPDSLPPSSSNTETTSMEGFVPGELSLPVDAETVHAELVEIQHSSCEPANFENRHHSYEMDDSGVSGLDSIYEKDLSRSHSKSSAVDNEIDNSEGKISVHDDSAVVSDDIDNLDSYVHEYHMSMKRTVKPAGDGEKIPDTELSDEDRKKRSFCCPDFLLPRGKRDSKKSRNKDKSKSPHKPTTTPEQPSKQTGNKRSKKLSKPKIKFFSDNHSKSMPSSPRTLVKSDETLKHSSVPQHPCSNVETGEDVSYSDSEISPNLRLQKQRRLSYGKVCKAPDLPSSSDDTVPVRPPRTNRQKSPDRLSQLEQQESEIALQVEEGSIQHGEENESLGKDDDQYKKDELFGEVDFEPKDTQIETQSFSSDKDNSIPDEIEDFDLKLDLGSFDDFEVDSFFKDKTISHESETFYDSSDSNHEFEHNIHKDAVDSQHEISSEARSLDIYKEDSELSTHSDRHSKNDGSPEDSPTQFDSELEIRPTEVANYQREKIGDRIGGSYATDCLESNFENSHKEKSYVKSQTEDNHEICDGVDNQIIMHCEIEDSQFSRIDNNNDKTVTSIIKSDNQSDTPSDIQYNSALERSSRSRRRKPRLLPETPVHTQVSPERIIEKILAREHESLGHSDVSKNYKVSSDNSNLASELQSVEQIEPKSIHTNLTARSNLIISDNNYNADGHSSYANGDSDQNLDNEKLAFSEFSIDKDNTCDTELVVPRPRHNKQTDKLDSNSHIGLHMIKNKKEVNVFKNLLTGQNKRNAVLFNNSKKQNVNEVPQLTFETDDHELNETTDQSAAIQVDTQDASSSSEEILMSSLTESDLDSADPDDKKNQQETLEVHFLKPLETSPISSLTESDSIHEDNFSPDGTPTAELDHEIREDNSKIVHVWTESDSFAIESFEKENTRPTLSHDNSKDLSLEASFHSANSSELENYEIEQAKTVSSGPAVHHHHLAPDRFVMSYSDSDADSIGPEILRATSDTFHEGNKYNRFDNTDKYDDSQNNSLEEDYSEPLSDDLTSEIISELHRRSLSEDDENTPRGDNISLSDINKLDEVTKHESQELSCTKSSTKSTVSTTNGSSKMSPKYYQKAPPETTTHFEAASTKDKFNIDIQNVCNDDFVDAHISTTQTAFNDEKPESSKNNIDIYEFSSDNESEVSFTDRDIDNNEISCTESLDDKHGSSTNESDAQSISSDDKSDRKFIDHQSDTDDDLVDSSERRISSDEGHALTENVSDSQSVSTDNEMDGSFTYHQFDSKREDIPADGHYTELNDLSDEHDSENESSAKNNLLKFDARYDNQVIQNVIPDGVKSQMQPDKFFMDVGTANSHGEFSRQHLADEQYESSELSETESEDSIIDYHIEYDSDIILTNKSIKNEMILNDKHDSLQISSNEQKISIDKGKDRIVASHSNSDNLITSGSARENIVSENDSITKSETAVTESSAQFIGHEITKDVFNDNSTAEISLDDKHESNIESIADDEKLVAETISTDDESAGSFIDHEFDKDAVHTDYSTMQISLDDKLGLSNEVLSLGNESGADAVLADDEYTETFIYQGIDKNAEVHDDDSRNSLNFKPISYDNKLLIKRVTSKDESHADEVSADDESTESFIDYEIDHDNNTDSSRKHTSSLDHQQNLHANEWLPHIPSNVLTKDEIFVDQGKVSIDNKSDDQSVTQQTTYNTDRVLADSSTKQNDPLYEEHISQENDTEAQNISMESSDRVIKSPVIQHTVVSGDFVKQSQSEEIQGLPVLVDDECVSSENESEGSFIDHELKSPEIIIPQRITKNEYADQEQRTFVFEKSNVSSKSLIQEPIHTEVKSDSKLISNKIDSQEKQIYKPITSRRKLPDLSLISKSGINYRHVCKTNESENSISTTNRKLPSDDITTTHNRLDTSVEVSDLHENISSDNDGSDSNDSFIDYGEDTRLKVSDSVSVTNDVEKLLQSPENKLSLKNDVLHKCYQSHETELKSDKSEVVFQTSRYADVNTKTELEIASSYRSENYHAKGDKNYSIEHHIDLDKSLSTDHDSIDPETHSSNIPPNVANTLEDQQSSSSGVSSDSDIFQDAPEQNRILAKQDISTDLSGQSTVTQDKTRHGILKPDNPDLDYINCDVQESVDSFPEIPAQPPPSFALSIPRMSVSGQGAIMSEMETRDKGVEPIIKSVETITSPKLPVDDKPETDYSVSVETDSHQDDNIFNYDTELVDKTKELYTSLDHYKHDEGFLTSNYSQHSPAKLPDLPTSPGEKEEIMSKAKQFANYTAPKPKTDEELAAIKLERQRKMVLRQSKFVGKGSDSDSYDSEEERKNSRPNPFLSFVKNFPEPIGKQNVTDGSPRHSPDQGEFHTYTSSHESSKSSTFSKQKSLPEREHLPTQRHLPHGETAGQSSFTKQMSLQEKEPVSRNNLQRETNFEPKEESSLDSEILAKFSTDSYSTPSLPVNSTHHHETVSRHSQLQESVPKYSGNKSSKPSNTRSQVSQPSSDLYTQYYERYEEATDLAQPILDSSHSSLEYAKSLQSCPKQTQKQTPPPSVSESPPRPSASFLSSPRMSLPAVFESKQDTTDIMLKAKHFAEVTAQKPKTAEEMETIRLDKKRKMVLRRSRPHRETADSDGSEEYSSSDSEKNAFEENVKSSFAHTDQTAVNWSKVSNNIIEENSNTDDQDTCIVDTKSISDLVSIKEHWESKLKVKPHFDDFIVNKPLRQKKEWNIVESSEESTKMADVDPYANESALEREIRLANEREQMLKAEQEERAILQAKMAGKISINKSFTDNNKNEISESEDDKLTFREMTEADRWSEIMKHESLKQENEDVGKQEDSLRLEAMHRTLNNGHVSNTEGEDDDDHTESFIEMEIRLQREREEELEKQRHHKFDISLPADNVAHKIISPIHSPNILEEPIMEREQTESASDASSPVRDLSYEDTISKGDHESESFIAKELREAKEREEEYKRLQQNRSQQIKRDASPSVQTPKVQSTKHDSNHNIITKQGTWQKDVSPYKKNNDRRGSMDSLSSSHSTGRSGSDIVVSRPVKVHPIVDNDDDEERRYRFKPNNETPIQREIRLNRERENQYRSERGLPLLVEEETPVETRTSKEPSLEIRHHASKPSSEGTLKRLSTSRLQQELKKEKEKELALREQGIIKTTSEDHISDLMRYSEISPACDSQPVKRNFVMRKSSSTGFVEKDKLDKLKEEATSDRNSEIHAKETPKSSPGDLLKRRSVSAAFSYKESRNSAETKIERELREMREREDELKMPSDQEGAWYLLE